jgi:hypothetical protein
MLMSISPPARILHPTAESDSPGVGAQQAKEQPPTHRAPEDQLHPSSC